MPAIPIIAAISTVAGAVSAVKGAAASRKAGSAAAAAPAPQVNIADVDSQARNIAKQNAIDSAALEQQFNPGAAELRKSSLQALLDNLNAPTDQRDQLAARIAASAGQPLNVGPAQQYDSVLTRQAVEAAANDLAMGGNLPQDVRNLVTRNALAKSGQVTGGLNLGRDLSVRDLGLTSLDLHRQRLATAAALGQQEAALNAGNAGLRTQNDAMRLSADQFSRNNLLQSGDFLSNLLNGNFARSYAAAQFGQNIAQPKSGLDPSAVANLAVGNTNAEASKDQQALAIQAQGANSQAGFGSSLVGTGLGYLASLNKPAAPAAAPATTYDPNSITALLASRNIFGSS